MTFDKLNKFTQAYIDCALWSSNDESNESGGQPMDLTYEPEDISQDTLNWMITDCKKFQNDNAEDIVKRDDTLKYTCEEYAGHDFWLTRNGHGAGFWDGDWPEKVGERLTKASKEYGECHLYVGDDGKIYHCEG